MNKMNKWRTVAILALCLPCAAWAQGEQTMTSTPTSAARSLKQDANLYQVDDKLFRSEQLVAEDKLAVQSLGIKSIINLRFFNRRGNEKLFTGDDIELLNRPLLTWDVKPAQIAHILWTIEQQQKKGAVLVHCYHGADRTGTVIGMYRIIYQGWTIEAAKREMQQGGFGYHSIWKNLERLFTEENVQKVRVELQKLRAAQS
ncbi:protein-tyrosine phosphatase family protein [Wielerella bovis]|uniref:phosphatase domain-containing protein n=1 Tax=Wielerella bovis TaxID=2917790 RepID=UPI003211EF78